MQVGQDTTLDTKTKRMLDQLLDECVCMVCSISNFDVYTCRGCLYLICYDCLGKILLEKFKQTGDRYEKCPQCRVVMKNLPIKLVYVNYDNPELSDVLTADEKTAIENAHKLSAKKKKE